MLYDARDAPGASPASISTSVSRLRFLGGSSNPTCPSSGWRCGWLTHV
jgi:hypothetical protein